MAENYFAELNEINCNDKTEKKGKLTYLSWVWAWGELKKRYPDSNYTVYENKDGWLYHTDGKTAWVKTGVTVNGVEHIEYLPVMDYNNKSIPVANITSYDVNKAIQRSLTKAIARHGIGLYIYAGEDLPECEQTAQPKPAAQPQQKQQPAAQPQQIAEQAKQTVAASDTEFLTVEQQRLVVGRYQSKFGEIDNDEKKRKYEEFISEFNASKTKEIKHSDLEKVLNKISRAVV